MGSVSICLRTYRESGRSNVKWLFSSMKDGDDLKTVKYYADICNFPHVRKDQDEYMSLNSFPS